MWSGLLHLFSPRPFWDILRDFIDVAVVAWVIYRALLVMRGTKALPMVTGLSLVGAAFVFARLIGLSTFSNLLSWLVSSLALIGVVVFQDDIRRALVRVGSLAHLGGLSKTPEGRVIDEVVGAATELARHRMGALICFEQEANLAEFVSSFGTHIDAIVDKDLLVSMFIPEKQNRLHDGAVVLRNLRILRAGVFFPMPEMQGVRNELGSRHRAAIGITESTDAIVVVVSEERGAISVCHAGNIFLNLDEASLRSALFTLIGGDKHKESRQPAPASPPLPRAPKPAPRPALTPIPKPAHASVTPPERSTIRPPAEPVPTSMVLEHAPAAPKPMAHAKPIPQLVPDEDSPVSQRPMSRPPRPLKESP